MTFNLDIWHAVLSSQVWRSRSQVGHSHRTKQVLCGDGWLWLKADQIQTRKVEALGQCIPPPMASYQCRHLAIQYEQHIYVC